MSRISIREKLTEIFSSAFRSSGYDPGFGRVIISDRTDLGEYQCNGALTSAKIHKRNPRDVAENVIAAIEERELFEDISVAAPGFINITLSSAYLTGIVQKMATDDRMGVLTAQPPKNVVIDFGGPNVAKPMHVGHLRSTIIGDSLQRLFRYAGDRVTSDIHLGDWGLQMGMLICELQRRSPELSYFNASYAGPYPAEPPVAIDELEEMYPAASAACKSDKASMEAARRATAELQQGRPGYCALWKHFVDVSVEALKNDLMKLGVSFDLWQGESHYNERLPPMIEELKAAGHARVSEGALVIPVASPSDKKEVPPLMLEKSEGGYLYGTTDLATVEERVRDFHAGTILYVVDKRQHLHLEQVFRAARIVSYAGSAKLEHIAFGTMNGPDNKPFKTRAGGVMKLKDLISMVADKAISRMEEGRIAGTYDAAERRQIADLVGIATLKFADLSNHRTSDYVFDLEKFSKFEGRTGPYVLYSAVRIKSILRKAKEAGASAGTILPSREPAERALMFSLAQLPDAFVRAYAERAPNYLCDFAFDLAQSFSGFYQQCHILREQDRPLRESWLALSQLCLRELETVLSILGISIPERM